MKEGDSECTSVVESLSSMYRDLVPTLAPQGRKQKAKLLKFMDSSGRKKRCQVSEENFHECVHVHVCRYTHVGVNSSA